MRRDVISWVVCLLASVVLGFAGCSGGGGGGGTGSTDTGACAQVSQGNSTVKVVNSTNSMIQVYFGTSVGFGADLAPGECNLVGIQLPSSYTLQTQVEITQCTPAAGGGCGAKFGTTKYVSLTLPVGQTQTITVGSDFFNNTTTTTYKTITIPDTGQTGDYTATFGEDSDYTINPPSYTDNGNGTVTDNVTGLVWQKKDDATTRTWDAAITYCSDNTAALPGTGWRLPTDFELTTIVDYGRYSPAIDPVFTNTQSSYYCSSTPMAIMAGDAANYAWKVLFSYGNVSVTSKTDGCYVRCVR